MTSRARPWIALALVASGLSSAAGDTFERLEGAALTRALRDPGAKAHRNLTLAEIDRIPRVLPDRGEALILVQTDQGNPARLLVSAALRRPRGSKAEPVPVLVLDRFDTFEAGTATTRLAQGKEMLLFDGFQVDLDSGHVVPEGQGGDLVFRAVGDGGPRLETLATARMVTLEHAPDTATTARPGPSPGRTVLPTDFDGRYRLVANGQWVGLLDLKTDAQGEVNGQFRSDLNGQSYPVTGTVSHTTPQRIEFRVQYPRTRQDFDAYLWTEGKAALSGTCVMEERTFGFFALREGSHSPLGETSSPTVPNTRVSTNPVQVVVESKDRFRVGGTPVDRPELANALRARHQEGESAGELDVTVPSDFPADSLGAILEAIKAAGWQALRVRWLPQPDSPPR